MLLVAPLLMALSIGQVQDRPNILFIYSDDHSAAAVSAYGSQINETPNLDRLAAEGMVFDNAFCTNGICAPARAVILTGLHSHLNGVRDNGGRLDQSKPTFPRLLKDAGYNTAIIGKWHLKDNPVGFDHWEVLPGQGNYYAPDFLTPEGKVREPGYVTDLTTDKSIQWLEDDWDREKPFLLMCQNKAPHRGWMPGPDHLTKYDGEVIAEPATLFDDWSGRSQAASEQEMTIDRHMYEYYDLKVPPADSEVELKGPDRWMNKLLGRMSPEQRSAWDAAYGPRNAVYRKDNPTGDDLHRWKYQRYIKDYLRCIASVDDNVGRLLKWLDDNGLAENTIVVYTSDQGFFLGEHGWYDKRFMYEPALRSPFIVRWPGMVESGTRDGHLVQNLDVAQTFLEVAGVPAPDEMQGQSMVPLLKGESPDDWRDSFYYEYFEKGIHAVQPHYGVRTDRYKLMYFPELDAWELYDLQTDPDEINNIAGDSEHKAVESDLRAELDRLRLHYLVPEAMPAAEG
ncbi:MAG: sulfatase [Phycisphaerales bacterium]|nr:sulfatase [Phycisphaerales bacterium]